MLRFLQRKWHSESRAAGSRNPEGLANSVGVDAPLAPATESVSTGSKQGRGEARQVIVALLVRLAPRVVTPVLLVAAVALLGVKSYGQVTIAVGFAVVLSQGSELGLNQLLIRLTAEGYSAGGLVRSVSRLKIALIVVVTLAASALSMGLGYSSQERLYAALALLSVYIGTFGSIADAALVAQRRYREATRVNAVLGIGSALLPLILIVLHPTPMAYLSGLVLANAGYTVAAFRAISASDQAPFSYRSLVRRLTWYAVSSVAEPIYSRADVVVLGYQASAVEAGIYAPMYAPLNVLWSIGDIVGVLLLPRMRSLEAVRQHVAPLQALVLPACFAYALAVPPVSEALLGARAHHAQLAGLLLAAAAALITANRMIAVGLRGIGLDRYVAGAAWGAAAIDVSVNVLFDAQYGAVAAGAAMLVTEFALSLALIVWYPRFRQTLVVSLVAAVTVASGCTLAVGEQRILYSAGAIVAAWAAARGGRWRRARSALFGRERDGA